MATVTAIRKDKDSGDQRASLRDAVAAAAEARDAVTNAKDALSRAQGFVAETRRKFESAGKRIAAAKAEDVLELAAVIASGKAAEPPQAAKQARELESEAGEALAMARAAREQLENDLKDAERAVERTVNVVNAAVAAVLKPTALRMIEEAKGFRAAFLQRQYALDALCMSVDGFERLRFDVREEEHRQLCGSVRQSWLDSIAALKRGGDIDALPDLG